ncbi:MAG: response regulator [Ruminiclostridium sp.]|nr:response regulator [Ruminiclostridium sp.]
MIKLMIADDEHWVREGLNRAVEWDKLGIEVVGCASNGQDAYDLYLKTKPRIIITDIKMPFMDGLELTRKIIEMDSDAYILLISAYSDFEYAKKALELGAMDYILKPFTKKNILEIVEKAVQSINRNDEKKELVEKSREYIKQYVIEKITGTLYAEYADIKKLFAENALAIYNKDIVVIVARFMTFDKSSVHLSDSDVGKRFYEYAQRYLSTQFPYVLATIKESGLFAAILGLDEVNKYHYVKEKILDLYHQAAPECRNHLIIGTGRIYETVMNTYNSYCEALIALNYNTSIREDRVYFFDDLMKESSMDSKNLTEFYARLENVITKGNLDEVKEILKELELLIIQNYYLYDYDLKSFFYQLVSIPVNILLKNNIRITEVFEEGFNINNIVNSMETIDEFKKRYLQIIEKVISYLEKKSDLYIRKDIEKSKRFINNHYCDSSISLNMIAEKIGLTPAYVSKLFKQELGISYIDYITDLRINKAKELLGNDHYKVYEIAEMTGYTNTNYFISLFKKHVGVSPSEYRK